MKKIALIIGGMIAGGVVFAAGFTWFAKAKLPAERTPTAERRVLFRYDPMYPNTRFDRPGKSPFMDMDLASKYADERSSASGVCIDPTQTQNLEVKTVTATRGPLTFAQSLPTNVSYNEYWCAIMQARAAGFINKVYPLTMGDKIQESAPLLDPTIPDWVEAQSECLLLHETSDMTTQTEDILERLRLVGIPEADIRRLIAMQRVQTCFTLKTPIDGVITAFDLCAGMNIAKNNVVTKTQDMDPVRVTATTPESIAWLVKDASQFTLTVPTRPDETLTIRKRALLPGVDAATRTLQLHLEVDNVDEALKPNMNARLQLSIANEPILLIPSQALIDAGNGQRVITVGTDGHFVPKRVVVFQASQDVAALRFGLAEGEEVVSSGLFLIDSEANISGALERMHSGGATYAH